MPSKIRVGIIGANVGYGWGARAHLPALKALSEYEVVAVCTSREETAKETARKFGIPLAFRDPEAMVVHKDIDLVDVCVRVPMHRQMVMAPLRAGNHVFCEWPLALNVSEAIELRDLAVERRVSNAVGLQTRGSPVINYVRDLIADGYVGQIVSCSVVGTVPGASERAASFAWAADPAMGANVLTIQSAHTIDALCFCVGDFASVTSIVATQTKEWVINETGEKWKINSPDHVLVSGTLKSGALASVFIASVPYHGAGLSFHIYGTGGTLTVTGAGFPNVSELTLRGARAGGKAIDVMVVPDKYRWVPESIPSGVL